MLYQLFLPTLAADRCAERVPACGFDLRSPEGEPRREPLPPDPVAGSADLYAWLAEYGQTWEQPYQLFLSVAENN
jgi:hypothetical protein